MIVLSSVPAPTNGSREAAACKAQKARESPTWRLERLRGSPLCVLSSLPRPGSRDVDCVGTRERPPPDGKQQCVTPLLSGAPVTTGGYNDFVKSTQRRAVTYIYLRDILNPSRLAVDMYAMHDYMMSTDK